MFTNKAITEVQAWAVAAGMGEGESAKQHLETLRHLGASLLASKEFQGYYRERYGREFDLQDVECVCRFLDTVAAIEVHQVAEYGPATCAVYP